MQADTFKDFVCDQLGVLPGLECRRMFGGHGLYAGGRFFGIIYRGELFFRTDERTVGTYLDAGMKPFRPNSRQTLRHYYRVPGSVLENRETVSRWAQEAVRAEGK